ncbi:MAG: hypothetical protein ACTHNP_05605 [Solirubrobacterales bacterium]
MVLALAGCGSGSSGTTETTEATSGLTKAEFVKKGNAICAKTEKEVAEGVAKFTDEHNFSKTKPPTATQIAELAEEVLVPKVRRQIDEIRALGIPSGDAEEVEAIFAASEEALKETEEDPSVFGRGGVGPFVKANRLSREYGLTVCGAEPEGEGTEGESESAEKGGSGE